MDSDVGTWGGSPSDPPTEGPPEPVPSGPMDRAAMQKLDPRVVVYWLLTGVFSALVLGAVLFTGAWFVADYFPEWRRVAWSVAGTLSGLNLAWALIAPPLAYSRWRYAVDAELMRMRYGILFHEERSIPINRMQHADLTRGPIERMFGLASLVVFSAGNEGSAFRVPGIAVSEAERLRDRILSARGDDVI